MTYREDVEGLDASILMHKRVWEASGHVDNFSDPMIDCKQCKSRFRVDTLGDALNEKRKKKSIKALEEKIENSGKKEALTKIYEIHEEFDARFEAILESEILGPELLVEINCPNCGTAGEFTEQEVLI